MKKTLTLFALAVVLASCNSNSKSKDSDLDSLSSIDTMGVNQSNNKYEKFKSTSDFAYGDVKFGISKKQFENLMPNRFVTIGNEEYLVDAVFTEKEGKLYQLSFSTLYKDASHVDTELKESVNNLTTVITKKYGDPDDSRELTFFRFKPGYNQILSQWNVLTKTIYVGMGEKYSGSEYYATLCITNNALDEAEQNKKESAKDSVTTEASSKF